MKKLILGQKSESPPPGKIRNFGYLPKTYFSPGISKCESPPQAEPLTKSKKSKFLTTYKKRIGPLLKNIHYSNNSSIEHKSNKKMRWKHLSLWTDWYFTNVFSFNESQMTFSLFFIFMISHSQTKKSISQFQPGPGGLLWTKIMFTLTIMSLVKKWCNLIV